MGLLIRIREALAITPAAHLTERRPNVGDTGTALGDDGFTELVRQALDELPDPLLDTLANTVVLVADGGAAVGAYGLYHGAGMATPDAPAQIVLYRDTLARDFGHDARLLREQVRRTVRHEVAHHVGYSEQGVAALGL